MSKEITIASFQAKDIRLQLVVKNDNTYVILNRKRLKIDWPYRKNWPTNEKIIHTFNEIINHFLLNEVMWRIQEDKKFKSPEDFK